MVRCWVLLGSLWWIACPDALVGFLGQVTIYSGPILLPRAVSVFLSAEALPPLTPVLFDKVLVQPWFWINLGL